MCWSWKTETFTLLLPVLPVLARVVCRDHNLMARTLGYTALGIDPNLVRQIHDHVALEQQMRDLMMNAPVRREGVPTPVPEGDARLTYIAVDPAAPEHTTVYWAKPENAYGPWEFKVESRDARFAPTLEGFTIANLRVWNRELRHEELVDLYEAEAPIYATREGTRFAGLPGLNSTLEPLPDDEIWAELEINNWPCGYEIIPKPQPRAIEFIVVDVMSRSKTAHKSREVERIYAEVHKARAAISDIVNIETTPSDTEMGTHYRITLKPL